jgi:type II secretory pathway pseudopilin PulG
MLLKIPLLPALPKLPHKALDMRQQYGSTLIEVTAAVMIMTIVSLSLIKLFTCGTLFVATASQDINALNRAQEVLEEIKAIKNSRRGFALGGDSNSIALDGEGIDFSGEYMVALTDGVGAGQIRKIAGFDPSSGRAFVEPCWVVPPEAQETTYLLLRDRPYRDNLKIIAVDSAFNLHKVTVIFIKQDDGQDGEESREISLTTEKSWW